MNLKSPVSLARPERLDIEESQRLRNLEKWNGCGHGPSLRHRPTGGRRDSKASLRFVLRTLKLVGRCLPSGCLVALWLLPSPLIAQEQGCRASVFDSLKEYTITPGETLTSLGDKFQLLPTTLMGLNPALRQGQATVGTKIAVPPYNGIFVSVPAGENDS